MKEILMIGTGGTIASEMTPEGYAPELTSEQLLNYVPDISDFCSVTCTQVCNLDSTNITPDIWLDIAETIHRNYDRYDGFVIAHGTDTMAYSAAAMSYLVQNSPKPIIFTGSQKPINSETTDSKTNLRDSFICASADTLSGVFIVFNGKVILGTRARKTHSKSFQAFSSINYPFVAVLQDGYLLQYIDSPRPAAPVFYESLDRKVGLVKMIPGTDIGLISYMLEHNDALIIESFGVGGLPSYEGSDFYSVIESAVKNGKTVLMTTQVQHEGSDLAVYNVGHRLKNTLNLLEAYDMTTEAAVAKLMWVLGQTKDGDKIRELFYTPIAHDILNQSR